MVYLSFFSIQWMQTNCWLRGISHGVPSHHSHSPNRPCMVMTQSQCFCRCVCVNICMPLRDKAALSSAQWEKQRSWLRTRSFLFSQDDRRRTNRVNQLRLLSGHCCDRRKERDETTQKGCGREGRKSKMSMGDRQTNWHKHCYVEMSKEVGERKMVLPWDKGRKEMKGNKRKVKENRREKEIEGCDRKDNKARDRVA